MNQLVVHARPGAVCSVVLVFQVPEIPRRVLTAIRLLVDRLSTVTMESRGPASFFNGVGFLPLGSPEHGPLNPMKLE